MLYFASVIQPAEAHFCFEDLSDKRKFRFSSLLGLIIVVVAKKIFKMSLFDNNMSLK